MSKLIITTILISALIILVGIFLANSNQFRNTPISSPSTIISREIPTPIPSPISQPAPIRFEPQRGVITKISDNQIEVRINDKLQVFNIANTKSIQRVVSGSFEAGDVKFSPSTKSDLKVGQEIQLTIDLNSPNAARSVYIIK
jgi:hypothetical protein